MKPVSRWIASLVAASAATGVALVASAKARTAEFAAVSWHVRAMPNQESRVSDNVEWPYHSEVRLRYTIQGVSEEDRKGIRVTVMEDKPSRPDRARTPSFASGDVVTTSGPYHKPGKFYVGRLDGPGGKDEVLRRYPDGFRVTAEPE